MMTMEEIQAWVGEHSTVPHRACGDRTHHDPHLHGHHHACYGHLGGVVMTRPEAGPMMRHVGSTSILNLGSLVSFDQVLRRATEQRRRPERFVRPGRETEPWKVWLPEPLNHHRFPDRYRRTDGRAEGIVVGIRTLSNGPVEWGSYDEPTVFYPREQVEAVMVAWQLRRVPVLVLPTNLELIER